MKTDPHTVSYLNFKFLDTKTKHGRAESQDDRNLT